MGHLSGVAAFFLIVLIILLLTAGGWIIYTHLRARRLGLPQPTLASYNPFADSASGGRFSSGSASGEGVITWVKSKLSKNARSAGGAYEEPSNRNVRGRGANRGFGPLDPDDAWDARVGTEADAYGPGGYYEEQELGLHGPSGVVPAPGSAYGEDRARALSRESEPYIGSAQARLDRRYDEEMGGRTPARNPFDDNAEVGGGLRGVSPRPMVDTNVKGGATHEENSATSRKDIFKENV
ncbi:hypothetical protein BJ878DRAFT_273210 [Calycina marina]|uniref:Acid phosphatase-like protein n=1 Tax=Calycina marina TaxID=1763456 RepID=A0A9P7YVX2_9HELO|nr:hypothetical protein BJ878DRAFT_273210 [Calycina marina]